MRQNPGLKERAAGDKNLISAAFPPIGDITAKTINNK
jgi:hypothetical protein